LVSTGLIIIDERIMQVILPTSVNSCKRLGGAFINEAKAFNQPYGRAVFRHNEGIYPMYTIFPVNDFDAFADTFGCITEVLMLPTEFVTEAAAAIGFTKKILKQKDPMISSG
jgi:hypothetical protein